MSMLVTKLRQVIEDATRQGDRRTAGRWRRRLAEVLAEEESSAVDLEAWCDSLLSGRRAPKGDDRLRRWCRSLKGD